MIISTIKKLSRLERIEKQLVIMAVDVLCIFFALWLAYSLRLEELYSFGVDQYVILIMVIIIAIPTFISFGLYRAIIRYVSTKALWAVLMAVVLFTLFWGSLVFITGLPMPHSIPIIAGLIILILIGGNRVVARSLFVNIENKNPCGTCPRNILIYGAGAAGVQLAKALEYDKAFIVKGFIDDDKTLHQKQILGLKISSFEKIKKQLIHSNKSKQQIEEILLAMPSVSRSCHARLISKLEPLPVHVKTLPSLSELAQGKITLNTIKEIDIADLLGRNTVQPVRELLDANILNKNILITGAGGSIGSELCRQIMTLKPSKIILYERCELALYQIEKELLNFNEARKEHIEITPILGCITNQKRLERTCRTFDIHTIYHAAAYKHVPMVEKNITEGVQNNIFGTYHSAQAAINAQVETFVLISTDKAVRPTNTMGATKRFAELILQGLAYSNKQTNTRFTMVRFGNVLGSSGSVIPLFKEQIRKGGSVTVTHPNIVRYFMTIPEAAQLVIQAGAMGKGDDVFVLDMGEPIRIIDLAKRMIRLSGYEVKDKKNINGDIAIKITGLRPGEKLYEELLIGNNTSKTKHEKIMRAEETVLPWDIIEGYINKLKQAIRADDEKEVRKILQLAVKGFKPQCDIADPLYKNKKRPAVIA